MIQSLGWVTGYNAIAILLAAVVLSSTGLVLNPAIGAVFYEFKYHHSCVECTVAQKAIEISLISLKSFTNYFDALPGRAG